MIDFHVDKAGSVPAYAQLVRQVREALRLGLLRPGDRLPTVREVVTSCTVNAATVLKAYRELEMSGLVESRQGSGTFVSGTLGSADPHVMARLRGGLSRWLDQAREAGLEDEDVQALVASVLAEQAAGAPRAGDPGPHGGPPVQKWHRVPPGSEVRHERGADALEARDLSKRYRDVGALRECSFQLPAHRIIALVGANGAGKSTLMSIAAGLLPATSGELLVGGQRVDPHRRPRPADAAHRVAILAQDKPLYRDFTVADMLQFGQRTNRVWDQQRALSWLERFDVPLERRCGRLSGGQRAQVALAVALGGCPGVLLLDEPLANLDPVARSEVTGELMAEVADSGMTVMLSTHIVAELAGVGEYLLLLAAGRPVLAGDVEELLAGHVRLTGPRADLPPCPGQIVQAQHTERQSTFIVRLPSQAVPAVVAPGWSSEPVSLEQLILTYLKTSAKPPRALEAAA